MFLLAASQERFIKLSSEQLKGRGMQAYQPMKISYGSEKQNYQIQEPFD